MIDTSIIIAALLSDITYERLINCRMMRYTLSYVFSEVARHKDELASWKSKKQCVSLDDVLEDFNRRLEVMRTELKEIPEDQVLPYWDQAFTIIGWRDGGDVPIVALALYLRDKLRTNVCIVSLDDDFVEATKHGFMWSRRPCDP